MPSTRQGRELNVCVIVFTLLTLATVILRFFGMRVLKRKWRADDYLILLAFVGDMSPIPIPMPPRSLRLTETQASLMAMEGTFWWTINHDLGASYERISAEDAAVQHKAQYSTGITWTIATVACKMAMLCLYLSLFTLGRTRVLVYVFMGLTVSYAIVFIPIFMAACKPPSAAWNPDVLVVLDKCRPIQKQEFASVSVNMVLDFAVVILPMPQVWKLQMAVKRKVMVSIMFGLGLIIVAVMAWRVQTTVESTKTRQWSQMLVKVALQSHLEIWLGIMAANLPNMAPVFSKVICPAMHRAFAFRSANICDKASEKAKHEHRSFDRLCDDDAMEYPLVPLPLPLPLLLPLQRLEEGLCRESESQRVRESESQRVRE